MHTTHEAHTHNSRRVGAIMIVDDEPALRTVGRAILSTLTLQTVTAASGEDALAALHVARQEGTLPIMILLDLTMPGGMSGLDTFDQMKTHYPGIPVVACSGFLGDGADEVCHRLGFAGMLPKPYTPADLETVIRRVLMRMVEHA
jgi:CheY-like chemotaxis protein